MRVRPRHRRRRLALAWAALVVLALGTAAWTWMARSAGPEPGPGVPLSASLGPWDGVVSTHVDDRGRVRYAAACADPRLARALAAFASAESVATAPPAERRAFRINAYNAFTVAAVCRLRPLRSLRDRPWEWSVRRIPVGRGETTLDALEREVRLDPGPEPRVHFALNCASASCPPLRAEAYRPDRLQAQLADQERRFAADRGLNPGPAGEGGVRVSSLFAWYAADFALLSAPGPEFGDRPAAEQVALRLLWKHGDPALRDALVRADDVGVEYAPWDWTLNEAR